jgi:hypothetical protein
MQAKRTTGTVRATSIYAAPASGWSPASLPSPWWEGLRSPCASLRSSTPGSSPAAPSGAGLHPRIRADLCGKGVTMVTRILSALASVASLFLVAGASARY